jgi:hypothetical protein
MACPQYTVPTTAPIREQRIDTTIWQYTRAGLLASLRSNPCTISACCSTCVRTTIPVSTFSGQIPKVINFITCPLPPLCTQSNTGATHDDYAFPAKQINPTIPPILAWYAPLAISFLSAITSDHTPDSCRTEWRFGKTNESPHLAPEFSGKETSDHFGKPAGAQHHS